MENNHVTDFLDFLRLVSPGTDDVNASIPRKVPLSSGQGPRKSPLWDRPCGGGRGSWSCKLRLRGLQETPLLERRNRKVGVCSQRSGRREDSVTFLFVSPTFLAPCWTQSRSVQHQRKLPKHFSQRTRKRGAWEVGSVGPSRKRAS